MPDHELRSAQDSVPIDWEAVRTHLAAHGHRLDNDPPPRQFAGGLANLNYLIHLDGKPAVLRRPPMGDLPAGAYDMAREFRILSRKGTATPNPTSAIETGRKDTLRLDPSEEAVTAMRFRDWKGYWPMHCHNTVHEDHGMMVLFKVV